MVYNDITTIKLCCHDNNTFLRSNELHTRVRGITCSTSAWHGPGGYGFDAWLW